MWHNPRFPGPCDYHFKKKVDASRYGGHPEAEAFIGNVLMNFSRLTNVTSKYWFQQTEALPFLKLPWNKDCLHVCFSSSLENFIKMCFLGFLGQSLHHSKFYSNDQVCTNGEKLKRIRRRWDIQGVNGIFFRKKGSNGRKFEIFFIAGVPYGAYRIFHSFVLCGVNEDIASVENCLYMRIWSTKLAMANFPRMWSKTIEKRASYEICGNFMQHIWEFSGKALPPSSEYCTKCTLQLL